MPRYTSPIDAIVRQLRIEKRYTNFAGRRFAAVVHKDGRRVDVILRESTTSPELLRGAGEIKVAAATKLLEQQRRTAAANAIGDDPFAGL